MDAQVPFLCQVAMNNWKNRVTWRNLWTILLFVFAAAVVLFLCASILLFIRESWLPGAITTVGTICSGTAIGWVVSRRIEAKQEEDDALKIVMDNCQQKNAIVKTPEKGNEVSAAAKEKGILSTAGAVEGTGKPEDELIPEVKKLIDDFSKKQEINLLFKRVR